MSKNPTLEESLAEEAKGRKLTKRMRKVVADSKRDVPTLNYRSIAFPQTTPVYFGDIDKRASMLKQELILLGKLREWDDTKIQTEIDKAVYNLVKTTYKFYNIKMNKEKQTNASIK